MIVKVRDPRFDDAVHSGRLKHVNLVSTDRDKALGLGNVDVKLMSDMIQSITQSNGSYRNAEHL